MAELAQGQSAAPVGIKPEGFVDALHRVRQRESRLTRQKRSSAGREAACSPRELSAAKLSSCTLQWIAAKIGDIPHLNNSTTLVDPSVYGYGVQKRPLDDGGLRVSGLHGAQIRDTERIGNQLGALVHQRAVITEEFKVPDKMVGFIIGRGGEQISRIQAESGCKIQIAPDSGGMPERPCVLTGTPESIEQAKRLLGQIVDRCRNGPGFHNDVDGNSTIQEILIPASKVGLVIGKGGETIKQLQERTGVKMIMIQDGPLPTGADKPLRITGDAFKVQERDGFGSLAVARGRGRGRGDWSVGTPGGMQEITYTVPADKCGLVIGKGGENIKSINQQSGAHVELQRNPPPNTDPGVRIFTIRGVPQQIELARHLIDEKVGGTSMGGPGGFGQSPFSQAPATPHQNGPQAFMTQGWGSTYQTWQQPGQQVPSQQSQQQNSHPDYSKAWEEYFKKQSHAASAASQASSQPDYTMAWAEYYRQQAAYYGQTLGQAQAHSQEQ
ncbi:far upstream element-binding protein 3 isoform X11 [Calonectris borealis]|uniref:far upstream element-binding protein 3 isoform X11 n=1 Tax=Calonectris borealis TaxID=1323832 RepID=UPI003F4B094B